MCSLCKHHLLYVKARYLPKEVLVIFQHKKTTTEEGIQYLREMLMMEVIYGNFNNNSDFDGLHDVQLT